MEIHYELHNRSLSPIPLPISSAFLTFSVHMLLNREESHEMEAARCWLSLPRHYSRLPSETWPSTHKQKGSMANLTFPFSSSHHALGYPFISIDCWSLHCLSGWVERAVKAGWICWAICKYGVAHAWLVSVGTGTEVGDSHTQNTYTIEICGRHTRSHACTCGHLHLTLTTFRQKDAKSDEWLSPGERGLEWPQRHIIVCFVSICLPHMLVFAWATPLSTLPLLLLWCNGGQGHWRC